MTWSLVRRSEGNALVATLERGGEPVSVEGVWTAWADDPAFRRFFSDRLREVPFTGWCWECPPATAGTLDRPFECRFVESPALVRAPAEVGPFSEHFDDGPVVTFWSLGGDALLVAPCPRAPHQVYAHIAAFVRHAPPDQVDALWVAVAAALRSRVGDEPLWLSTAGLGVIWLHVRLDRVPKYYRTAAYKAPV